MAIHELATNSAKHGALSVEQGRLKVSWTIDPGSPDGLAEFPLEGNWRTAREDEGGIGLRCPGAGSSWHRARWAARVNSASPPMACNGR